MTKLIIKSLVFGFVIGTIFMGIAPLGLGIAFVEFLRPLLIPGINLLQSFWQSPGGSPALLLGLFLNGIIYAMLFLSFSLSRKQVVSRKAKHLISWLVALLFLAVTGMLTNVVVLLSSENRSWIFQLGASSL